MPPRPVAVEALRRRCDPAALGFADTRELAPLEEPLGQERALGALRFALRMRRPDYHVFVLGPEGVGRLGMVRELLAARAKTLPTPSDWVYVHDFANPQVPRALRMEGGRGRELAKDADELVDELRAAIQAMFDSEELQRRKQAIEEEARRRPEEAVARVRATAAPRGVAVVTTPNGFLFAPLKDGEPISPEAFAALAAEEQDRLRTNMQEVQHELAAVLADAPRWDRERRAALRELLRETTTSAVRHALADLHEKWAADPGAAAWLRAVEADAVESAEEFVRPGPEGGQLSPLRRYRVNVFVEHHDHEGAPVVYEDHPTHPGLVGAVDHLAMMGALLTDFLLLRPGALHRANGGWLVLDALRVLQQPLAWDALKRALRARQVRVGALGKELGLVSTVSLEPEPIPLDVQVVLIGERPLYYLLSALDPDFGDLFKIPADFGDDIPWGEGACRDYARLVAGVVAREQLRPFTAAAVARLVEEAARIAEDAARLSVHQQTLHDRMREADCLAGEAAVVDLPHVEAALAQRIRFADRVRERLYEQVRRGVIAVRVGGEAVGSVNGLSVLDLGGFRFGQPSRISARVRPGRGQLVDIEREVKLGGPSHSKGVFILGAALAARLAPDAPLSLHATLAFEQSYGGVDGDSASMAELVALVSALAELPVRQSVAITGSVDQHGRAQAIGGVNEKIEGFFDVCALVGLEGQQVLVPETNLQHLMLRPEVVAAVAAGRFGVAAFADVDEAIEGLTGVPAAEAWARAAATAARFAKAMRPKDEE